MGSKFEKMIQVAASFLWNSIIFVELGYVIVFDGIFIFLW